MKTVKVFSFMACLCLVLSFSLTSYAQTTILSLSDQNPDTSWGPVHGLQPWVKQVEKATGGRVKIQIYPNQTLAKGRQNWIAVKDGIADMSWNVMTFYTGLAPYAEVITLPGLPFRTGEKGAEVLWKLYEKFPEIREQLADNKVLVLYPSPAMFLLCAKKQVKNLENIQGMKIRVAGGLLTEVIKNLGANPMAIPMPDCYIAMQRGTIDAMCTHWEPMPGFKLHEVGKYITDNTPFAAPYFSIVMNLKKWNSFPKDIQDAIMSVSGLKGSKFLGRNFFDSAFEPDTEYRKMLKREGYNIPIYSLSEKEAERWFEIGVKPVWEKWIKSMEEKGYTKAREILNAAVELSK